jgi:NAD(P)-dependent dehydrogenase (short-subunit alcohol dehydrogenase family)
MAVKNAVVTGGSTGIGKSFMERLVRDGYRVYILSHDSEVYRKEISDWQGNDNIIPLIGDITDPNSVDELVSRIESEEGYLDLLINNAAILDEGDGPFPPLTVFRKTLEVDLLGQYHLIYKLIPLLRNSESAIIINISSGSGSLQMVDRSGPLAYRVSKAGLNMLTKSLSYDLAEMNIAIHAVDPGFVDTKLSPGGVSPREAVDGMWHLTQNHDLNKTGRFWYHKDVIKC